MCALALATSVPPKASKGTPRPYADKPQRQWEHFSYRYLENVDRVETHLLPQCTLISAQAQTIKASNSVFHHSLGFSSVL